MVDVTSYVTEFEIDLDQDQPVAGATVVFQLADNVNSLSPLRTDSALNRLNDGITYSPLVDLNRAITIEVATTAIGASIQNGDFKLLFDGTVHSYDAAKALTAQCLDKSGQLVKRWIEATANYGSGPGVALETVMQQELDAVFGAGVWPLNVPVSPAYNVSPAFQQQLMSVSDALIALQQLRGWDTRYKWSDALGHYALTLYDVNRTKSTPDYTFAPDGYIDITRLELAETDIRNAIKVEYPTGGGARASVVVTDANSIAKYERQFAFIQEADDSPINTSGEATTLGNSALADLKDPKAEQEVELPFFWPAELTDLYRFSPNGVHFDTNLDLAVVAIKHRFKANSHRTFLTMRGSPCSGYLTWLARAKATQSTSSPSVHGPIATITPANTEVDDNTIALTFDAVPGSGGGGTNITWALYKKRGFAAEILVTSGDGTTLPHTENAARDPRLDQDYRFVVTDTALSLSDSAHYSVTSSRPDVNNSGNPKRGWPADDGYYHVASSSNDGFTAHGSVKESGGKSINRLFAKPLLTDPDNLDSVTDGTSYGRLLASRLSGGVIRRNAGFDDGRTALRGGATDTTGLNADSGLLESGGKAINRLFAKPLSSSADNLDSVTDGTSYGRLLASKLSGGALAVGGSLSDGTYIIRSDSSSSNQLNTAIVESGGKSVNRLYAKPVAANPDNADSIGDGATTRVIPFSIIRSSDNYLATGVNDAAIVGSPARTAASVSRGTHSNLFSENWDSLTADAWQISYGTGASASSGTGTTTGTSRGRSVLIANGYVGMQWRTPIPFDQRKLYRFRFRYCKSINESGGADARMYAGFVGADAGNTPTNNNGGAQYVLAAGQTFNNASGWIENTAWVKGVSWPYTDNSSMNGNGVGTPDSPMPANAGTVVVYPYLLINYPISGTPNGQALVDYFEITEYDEDGQSRTYSTIDNVAPGRLKSAASESGGKAVNRLYAKALSSDADTGDSIATGALGHGTVAGIDGSNKITPSSSAGRNRAKVYSTGGFTLSNNTLTPLSWSTVDTDVGGWWTSGSPTRLTIPAGFAGRPVFVSAMITFNSNATGDRIIVLSKNGVVVGSDYRRAAANHATVCNVGFFDPNPSAGDYYELSAQQDSGGNLAVPGLVANNNLSAADMW